MKKWLLALIVIVVAVLTAPITFKLILETASLLYFWLGFIIFTILHHFIFDKRFKFLQTLDHELSHMIISLLFGNVILELNVKDNAGGNVRSHGRGHGSILISLAPYVLRIPVIILLVLSQLLLNKYINLTYFLYGSIIAYSLFTIHKEARPHQPDLLKHGLIYSYILIVALNIIWTGIVASIILNNRTLVEFIKLSSKIFK